MADVIPILDCIDELVSRQSDDVAWLMRAGPVAKRMNEECRDDPLDGDGRPFGQPCHSGFAPSQSALSRPFGECQAQGCGWADQRLGRLYREIELVRDSLPSGNTETGCLSDALKAVELADVHIEKRERDA